MPKMRERKLRGVEAVTLLQAYAVRRRSAEMIRQVEGTIERLEKELEAAVDKVAAIELERDGHVERLVGYINAEGAPEIPVDLERISHEGDESDLTLRWEPEVEPEASIPEAPAIGAAPEDELDLEAA